MGPALLIFWAVTSSGVATTTPFAFVALRNCLDAAPVMVEKLPELEGLIGPWKWRCVDISRDEVL